MDTHDLTTIGLITITFAIPLLAPLADDIRKRRLARRLVPQRVVAGRPSRDQAHGRSDLVRS
jgi:hypothetical protein